MPEVRCPKDIAVTPAGKQSYGKNGWFDATNVHITAAVMSAPGETAPVLLCVDGAPGGKIARAILSLTPDDMIKVAKELLAQAEAAKAADEEAERCAVCKMPYDPEVVKRTMGPVNEGTCSPACSNRSMVGA